MRDTANSHPEPTLLTRFGQGRLAEADSAAIETHLSECGSCRQALETVPPDPFIALLRSTADAGDRPPLALHFGYERLEELGRGGMGVVYRARQTGLNRFVALKMIRHGVDASPATVARFRREAEAVGRLHHPNVVQVYEVGEQNGQPFLALELVEGPSLARALAGGPLEPRAAAELVAVLARAVAHAHARGLVHRDLKPANVLLQPHGPTGAGNGDTDVRSITFCALRSDVYTPKVTDFGLAKHLYATAPGPTETGAVLGSPCYMAPEQTAARPDLVGPATDVYALGAILYECLCGRPPFQGPTVLETLRQVADEDPAGVRQLQPAVPLDLETICHKCLRKEPAGRYASAEELTDDLERFLRGEPVRARPAGRAERVWKWARRKPAVAALLGLLALLPFAAAAGVAAHESQLRAQVQRAEAAAAESRRQQQRADRNYRMARDSIGRMLENLRGNQYVDLPRLTELQAKQAEEALAFFDAAGGDVDDPDPAVRLDVARASESAAQLAQMLGRNAVARDRLLHAVATCEELQAAGTGEDCRELLAVCLARLGSVSRDPGNLADSERDFQRSLDILERLARERRTPALAALAFAHHNLAGLYLATNRAADAEPHLRTAADIRLELMKQAPTPVPEQALGAAQSLANLAHIYGTTGRSARARETYEQIEQLIAPVLAVPALKTEAALTAAGARLNMAELFRREGKDAEAIAVCTRGLDLAEPILARDPGLQAARQRVTALHGSRGQAYLALDRFREAASDYDRLVELSDGAERDQQRVTRCALWSAAGEHARALAEADELLAKAKLTDLNRFNLALAYSMAAGAKAADPSDRGPGAKAVSLLRQTRASGFLKQMPYAALVREAPEFNPLRARPDFKQLLQGP